MSSAACKNAVSSGAELYPVNVGILHHQSFVAAARGSVQGHLPVNKACDPNAEHDTCCFLFALVMLLAGEVVQHA